MNWFVILVLVVVFEVLFKVLYFVFWIIFWFGEMLNFFLFFCSGDFFLGFGIGDLFCEFVLMDIFFKESCIGFFWLLEIGVKVFGRFIVVDFGVFLVGDWVFEGIFMLRIIFLVIKCLFWLIMFLLIMWVSGGVFV